MHYGLEEAYAMLAQTLHDEKEKKLKEAKESKMSNKREWWNGPILIVLIIVALIGVVYYTNYQDECEKNRYLQEELERARMPVPTRNPNNPCAGLPGELRDECQASEHLQAESDYTDYLADKAMEELRREQAEEALSEITIARGEKIYTFDKARLARTGDLCRCDGNYYNCVDFPYQSEAQNCYEDCVLVGAGDIHWLDDDGDGQACETLP